MAKKEPNNGSPKRPTLKTIAEKLGVNPSTVSRVINEKEVKGKFTVNPELRREILRMCEKLNYRPNVMARAIKTQKTMTIGAFGYLMSPYFYNMLLPAQREACNHGYTVTVHARDGYDSIDTALSEMFKLWQYDGVLAVGSDAVFQKPIIETCADHNVPLVIIGQPLGCDDSPNVKCVGGDYYTSIVSVVEYLYGLGHTSYIVFMRDPNFSLLGRMYYSAIKDGMKKFNIPVDNLTVVNTSHDPYEANQITQDYFNRLKLNVPVKKWPTVAIAVTQTMGTLHGIQAAGISVPDDISFITMDNTVEHIADHLNPGVAASYEPSDLFGRESIQLLIEMIHTTEDEPIAFEFRCLPKEFRENPSCIPLKEMHGSIHQK